MIIRGHRSLTSSSLWVATPIHHEDREGHEDWITERMSNPKNISSFVLFMRFVVISLFAVAASPARHGRSVSHSCSASLVRADLPVDVRPARPLHPRFLADSWAGQKYSRANRACPDLTVQR